MSAQETTHCDYRELLARHGRLHWWLRGMRQIVWALLDKPQGHLLDIGCGPGWLITEAPPGVWAIGLDLELQFARARPVVKGDAHRLPFHDRSFAIVTALDVLEQDGIDAIAVLAETRRVLVPNGRLLVRVPALPELYGPHDGFWGGVRRYRRAELERLIRHAGFAIHRLTYANSLLLPVGAAVRLAARFGRLSGNDLYPAPPLLNRLLTGILTLEARWLRTHDFPLGLSLLCLAEPR